MNNGNPLKCLVVDDEPLAAALIAGYVNRTPFLQLKGECNSADEALEFLHNNSIDLLFLDIRMPRLSGLDLAKLVSDSTKIIFTTAYADHALDGFRVHAFDYLLKPVSYDEFYKSSERAYKISETTTMQPAIPVPGHLVVKSEYRILRIPFSSIDYIEGLKDYVKVYTDGSNKPVLTLMSMKNLEDLLPEPTFMRIHRSFIVNLDKVRVVERNCIIMNDQCIPVSDSNRRKFFAAIGMSE